MTLHTSNFDYNDNLLPTGSYLFTRIVEDRLGVSILREEKEQDEQGDKDEKIDDK